MIHPNQYVLSKGILKDGLPPSLISLRHSGINVDLEQFLAIDLIKLHKSIFHSLTLAAAK